MKLCLSVIGCFLFVITVSSQELVWIDTLPRHHEIFSLVKDGQGLIASETISTPQRDTIGLAIYRYSSDRQRNGIDTIVSEAVRSKCSETAVDKHGNLY